MTKLQTRRFHVYIHVYQIIKNQGPSLYNSSHHTDIEIIANKEKYLQSDWLRGVQYWLYL